MKCTKSIDDMGAQCAEKNYGRYNFLIDFFFLCTKRIDDMGAPCITPWI